MLRASPCLATDLHTNWLTSNTSGIVRRLMAQHLPTASDAAFEHGRLADVSARRSYASSTVPGDRAGPPARHRAYCSHDPLWKVRRRPGDRQRQRLRQESLGAVHHRGSRSAAQWPGRPYLQRADQGPPPPRELMAAEQHLEGAPGAPTPGRAATAAAGMVVTSQARVALLGGRDGSGRSSLSSGRCRSSGAGAVAKTAGGPPSAQRPR